MNQGRKTSVWFNEVGKDDVPSVGGKGANLGEMTRANIPVPPGFIVTANAYFDFLQRTKITDKIRELLKPLDTNDSKQLQQIAGEIKQVILNAPILPDLASEIKEAYVKMGKGLVAVRSSATAEDLPEASFAGQQRTFLNVQGEEEVVTTSETYFHIPNVEEPGLGGIEVGCIIAALGQKDNDGTFTAQIVAVVRARRLRKMIVRRNTVRGEVTAIEGTTLTVETWHGEQTILTDENTRFRIPEVENPSIGDIKMGDRIIVLGRRNEDGDFVAKVVGVPKGNRLSPETGTLPLDLTKAMPSGEIIY